MQEGIRIFKTPDQKGNYTYVSTNRHIDTPLIIHQNNSATMSLCHIDMLFSNITKIDTIMLRIGCGKVFMILLLQIRIESYSKQTLLYRVIILILTPLEYTYRLTNTV